MKKFFERILALLDHFVLKEKSIIVFSGNNLRGIIGNVAYVIKSWPNNSKRKQFKSYVLSLKKEKFPGLETINPRTIKGIVILLRAHTVVFTHGPDDIYWGSLTTNRDRRVINLWHGSPIKKIGPWTKGGITYSVASSMIERLAISASTGVPMENVVITGLPRADRLIKNPKKLKQEALNSLNLKDNGQKWILYVPTYRVNNKVEGYLHRRRDFLFKELKKLLEKHNAYLLVRPHINDPFSDFPEDKRIILAPVNKLSEIEPLYALADVLITDYSSSIFEYVVLNRPIIGFAPDLDEYNKSPGLLYDYGSIFPGPVAADWKGLRKLIEEEFKEPSKHESVRADRLRMFQKFLDGKSTERVIDLIVDMSIG